MRETVCQVATAGSCLQADPITTKLPFDKEGLHASAGRIPAGFNGCVGLKATVGRVSTTGVVPACASLDCLTCFATNVRDAATVMQIMQVQT